MNKDNGLFKDTNLQDCLTNIRNFTDAYDSMDAASDPNLEDMFRIYAKLIYRLLCKTVSAHRNMSSDFQEYMCMLNDLLLFKSIRTRNTNQYLVPEKHPILQMSRYAKTKTENDIDSITDDTVRNISKSIYEHMTRHSSPFEIYTCNQVYQVADRSSKTPEFYHAVPFAENETNTKISAIHLMDKIEDYRKTHGTENGGMNKITIACFGELCETDNLINIYAEKGISLEINMFCHERNSNDPYLYSCGDEMYSLSYPPDLKQLMEFYEIVLFLDLNCFLKQRQKNKSVSEQYPETLCKWYLERSVECTDFRDKAMYYQMLHRCAGMWLNTYESNKTAQYTFDKKLLLSLTTTRKSKTDIYIYLKTKDQMADENYNNSCHEEYYSGQQMIVYRFTPAYDYDDSIKRFLKNGYPTDGISSRISCRDILTRITDDCFTDHILSSDRQDTIKAIQYGLQDAACILRCGRMDEKRNMVIHYHMCYGCDLPDETKHELEKIMSAVLTLVFQKDNAAYVRRFLRKLLVNSIIKNAENMQELLIAHILSREKYAVYHLEKEHAYACRQPVREHTAVTDMLYNLIEQLPDLYLRRLCSKESYYINHFRREVCPSLDKNDFKNALSQIRNGCEHFGYDNTRLYQNSML